MTVRRDLDVRLETDRLLLCRWRMADLPVFHRWLNSPDINRTLPVPGEVDLDMARVKLGELISLPERDGIHFAIWSREPLRLIGGLGLVQRDLRNRHAQAVVFMGGPDLYGKGYVLEAGRRMLEYAFAELGLRKVWLAHHGRNVRAHRVAQALGFTEVGRQREHCLFEDEWADWVTMELFADEYAKLMARPHE